MQRSHCIRLLTDLVDFCEGRSPNVGPSVLSVPLPASKKFRFLNFSGSDGSVGQSDRVVQVYANTLADEMAFAMRPGKTWIRQKAPRLLTDVCSVNAALQSRRLGHGGISPCTEEPEEKCKTKCNCVDVSG